MKSSHQLHFTDTEEKIFWIEKVLCMFREGTASPEDIENLRALLLEDSEARQIYRDSNQLTNLLELTASSSSEFTKLSRPPITWTHWAIGVTGIAALLVLGVLISFNHSDQSPAQAAQTPWLATLSSSHEAKWDGPAAVAGKFYSRKLKLESGLAELEFQNGARFVIEGPCALEILTAEKIELKYGKIWGHCPPAAHGFEVLAPGGNRIVDLGTEFGVNVDPSDPIGSVDVHVFDGEVEVFTESLEKKALGAGSAVQISPGAKPLSLNANFDYFTDATQLQNDLYQQHHASLLAREDLLLYYDFASLPKTPYILDDQSSSELHGRVVGALSVKGRTTGKDALLFEEQTDTVALNLTHLDLGEGFTLAMWIKPTDFHKSDMALLNSDGFDAGRIHFQITDDGKLMTGISEVARFASPPNTIQTNEWQLVAVRWNLETQKAQLFLNGQALQMKENDFAVTTPSTSVNFGQCQFGRWGKRTYGHNRNFVGRIDEVTLFSSQLSESEMAQLYETSRP